MNNAGTVIIYPWMAQELNLKGNDLLVYALIYGFSQDGESEFFGSRSYIANSFNISLPTVDKALNNLVEMGYIEKISETRNNITFNHFRAFIGGKETLQGYKDSLYNNKHNIKNNNKSLSKDNDSAETGFNFGIQEKQKKTNLYVKCLEIIDEWTNDKQLKDLLVQYLNVCLEMKCIRGANQWKGMLNTLERVQQECAPHTFAEIIEQSIIRSWKTFYPIRDYPKGNSNFAHIQKSDEYVEPTNEELKIATDENGNPIVF